METPTSTSSSATPEPTAKNASSSSTPTAICPDRPLAITHHRSCIRSRRPLR
jgi:hypothetical protein